MSRTVIVGLAVNIPWLELQICQPVVLKENTQTGPRDVTEYRKTGKIVRLRGTSYPAGTPPAGFADRPEVYKGFAITRGIDADFWDAWSEQNKASDLVKNGYIIAYEKFDQVRGEIREYEGRPRGGGFESMMPDNDPRMVRATISGLSKVETEESRRGKVEAAQHGA